jgi:hypothetical protein
MSEGERGERMRKREREMKDKLGLLQFKPKVRTTSAWWFLFHCKNVFVNKKALAYRGFRHVVNPALKRSKH